MRGEVGIREGSLEEVTVQLRTNTWGRHSWVGWWWVQERSEGSGSGRLERNVRRSKLRTHGDFREPRASSWWSACRVRGCS